MAEQLTMTKVQALKDTSWMKSRYSAAFFGAKNIKQPQL